MAGGAVAWPSGIETNIPQAIASVTAEKKEVFMTGNKQIASIDNTNRLFWLPKSYSLAKVSPVPLPTSGV